MKRSTQFSLILDFKWQALALLLLISLMTFPVHAFEKTAQFSTKTQQTLPVDIGKLLLSAPTRHKIDHQRAKYFQAKHEAVSKAKVSRQTQKHKGKINNRRPTPPQTAQGVLPEKVSVNPSQSESLHLSAVIKRPDGSLLLRLNGRYTSQASKVVTPNPISSGPQGVVFSINNKEYLVPIGQTLLLKKP